MHPSRLRKRDRKRIGIARRDVLSPPADIVLEDRRLLAIVWTNRGTTDNFGVFGANANTARAVLDQAILYWNSYLDINTNYDLTVEVDGAQHTNGAAAGSTSTTVFNGRTRPNAGHMTIGSGTNGTGGGWFFDPTPADNSEYANIYSPYVAYATGGVAQGLGDFLTVTMHELSHALGYNAAWLSPTGPNFNNPFTTNTNQTYFDPTSNPPSATYWVYNSPTTQTVLTNYDSGNGGQAFTGPVHSTPNDNGNGAYSGAPASVTFNGTQFFTSVDLMNPFYAFSERKLISENVVNILRESVGWGVGSAQLANNFISFDANGNLRIQGDSSDNFIRVATDNFGFVNVTVTTGIPGVIFGNTITRSFLAGTVRSLFIDAQGGNDVVDISGFLLRPLRPTVLGGAGNDSILGSPLDDILDGGDGNDTIFGNDGNDSITGGTGNDSLDGGDGNDTLLGGIGNDTLISGAGNNVISDTSGNNLVDWRRNSVAVNFTSGDGNDTIYGTPFDDTLNGAGGNDHIFGLGGMDLITGGAGDDTLEGGDGADTFIWRNGDGDDVIDGGGGQDTIRTELANQTNLLGVSQQGGQVVINLFGGRIVQGTGLEIVELEGGTGNDTFTIGDLAGTAVTLVQINSGLGQNAVIVEGTEHADKITVTRDSQGILVSGLSALVRHADATLPFDRLTVRGLGGDDTLKADSGVEALTELTLDGGEGNDILSGDAILIGGPGDDIFFPPAGVNTIDGGGGFNQIFVDGNAGNNTIHISQVGLVITITVDGVTSINTTTNIQRIVVNGFAGNDTITLTGLLIPVLVDAGAGNDLVDAAGVAAVAVTLLGGDGNDTLIGGAGNDSIDGGAGDDSLVGNAGADWISGGDGNDTIIGGPGNDSLFGGADSDLFIWNPGDGSDLIEGGTGEDRLVVNGAPGVDDLFVLSANGTRLRFERQPGGVVLDAADIEQVDANAFSGADTIIVNDLTGTSVKVVNLDLGAGDGNPDRVTLEGRNVGEDIALTRVGNAVLVEGLPAQVRITGSFASGIPALPTDDILTVNGNGGNDRIVAANGVAELIGLLLNGGDGDDYIEGDATINGGNGDDTLIGGDHANLITGGPGNDTIFGNGGNDTLLGDDGDDVIHGGDGDDFIDGGNGNDALFGDDGNDSILGGNGNDFADGGNGNDTIRGGDGNDYILGGEGADLLFGDDGNDTIYGGGGNDNIRGGAGNDDLNGDDGDDLINGDDGDDRITGGDGNDTLYGDEGDDWISGGRGNDFIDGGNGNDSLRGDEGDDSILGGNGNDTIDGGDGRDTIRGGNGDDLIYGGGGNDLLFGDDGNDTIRGGDGNDTIRGGAGNDDLGGDDGDDLINGDEGNDIIYGGNGNDLLFGDDGNDTIRGGNGNDTIRGGFGDDDLDGEDGNDTIYGDEGNDRISGGDGNDILSGGEGNDTIYGGRGNDSIEGGAGDDWIDGGEGDDVINGGDGNDTIYGGDGDDIVHGGNGADLIYGGNGRDRLCGDDGNDTIYGGDGDDAITGGDGDDVIFGEGGNDQLWGSDGNDWISGGDGNDTIVGGNGNDTLMGDDGNDVMFGQAGNDVMWGGNGNDLMYGGDGDDIMLGGTPLTANQVHQPRDPNLPNDGNDTMLGGNGFDQVDGGNGDNVLDAGDDGIPETVLGGTGNDIIYSHLIGGQKQADSPALDGGYNQDFHRGGLVEPPIPAEVCDFVNFAIPAWAYTGQNVTPGGQVVEHPPVKQLPGHRRPPARPVVKPVVRPSRPAPRRNPPGLKKLAFRTRN